jgi:hypothetical protein
MPVRKNIVFLPKFNEWIFNYIRNSPKDIKGELNSFERSWIRTKSAIKRWVNNSIIDRKLSLFTKMGMDWALLVFDPNNFDAKDLAKVYKQYAIDGQPLENINDMIRQQCFVVTSKEVALCMSMMASNCHSEVFRINQEFLKVRESIRDMAQVEKFSSNNQNLAYAAAEDAHLRVARIMFHALEIENYLQAVIGLQPVDIKILIILRQYPNNFLKVDAIQRRLSHSHQPSTVAARARILFEAGYLEKLPTTSKVPSYQIKSKGILTLGEVLNKLTNQSSIAI